MDTALPQKFPFILDRNLAKANCTGNRVCTSCDTVVLVFNLIDERTYFNGIIRRKRPGKGCLILLRTRLPVTRWVKLSLNFELLVNSVMKFLSGQRLFNNNIFVQLELFLIQETIKKMK